MTPACAFDLGFVSHPLPAPLLSLKCSRLPSLGRCFCNLGCNPGPMGLRHPGQEHPQGVWGAQHPSSSLGPCDGPVWLRARRLGKEALGGVFAQWQAIPGMLAERWDQSTTPSCGSGQGHRRSCTEAGQKAGPDGMCVLQLRGLSCPHVQREG